MDAAWARPLLRGHRSRDRKRCRSPSSTRQHPARVAARRDGDARLQQRTTPPPPEHRRRGRHRARRSRSSCCYAAFAHRCPAGRRGCAAVRGQRAADADDQAEPTAVGGHSGSPAGLRAGRRPRRLHAHVAPAVLIAPISSPAAASAELASAQEQAPAPPRRRAVSTPARMKESGSLARRAWRPA